MEFRPPSGASTESEHALLVSAVRLNKPSLQSYGLSPDDVPALDRRQKRISSLLFNATVGFGLLGGTFFAAGYDGFMGKLEGAWVGGIIAYMIAGAVAKYGNLTAFARMFDPRLQRYAEFRDALKAFEEWDVRTRSEFWRALSGHRFEQELATLFGRHGYDVERTPGSGDHGIDIILRRSDRTTVVQCKQTKHPVGPAVARELYGALVASNADDGILAVVGGVTRGVHRFFVGKPLRVMDLREILDLHKTHDM